MGMRCAIYTRKSTTHKLDLEFSSLDAQREACEHYILAHAHEAAKASPRRISPRYAQLVEAIGRRHERGGSWPHRTSRSE